MTEYKHKEAFCLMIYENKDGSIQETLWNSRDGVTPYIIRDRSGSIELTHVKWGWDHCVPNHKPRPGDRIFASITLEKARESRTRYVEKYWDESMEQMFGSKANAIEKLAEADYSYGGGKGLAPIIEVVPEATNPGAEDPGEHPTYHDDPTPDEPIEALPLASQLVDEAHSKQQEAIKQGKDLAFKGYAAVVGTEPSKGIWMVMEGTMRDWRIHLRSAQSSLLNLQQHLGDFRISTALDKIGTLLKEMPGEEPFKPTPENPGFCCNACTEFFPIEDLKELGGLPYDAKCAAEKARDDA